MSREDNRLALHHLVKLTRYFCLSMSIQVAGRLVKQEYLGIFFQQPSSDKHPLSLSPRQLAAKITDLRIIPMLHGHNSVMNLTLSGDVHDLIHGCILIPILQIEEDGVVKQNSILGDDRDMLAEAFGFQPFEVLPVNGHLAAYGVIDAEE